MPRQVVLARRELRVASLAIAQRSTCRWQVELFFKRITQLPRINSFSRTPENAPKTQIGIAISVCVLAAILKKKTLAPRRVPLPILPIASLTLFLENTPQSIA